MDNISVTGLLYAVGEIPLMIIIFGPSVMIEKILAILSIMITTSAFGWIMYLISYNRLSPLINKINPEEEEVWLRITKNHLFVPQVAKKGVYGQTKGVMHGKKADVIDKGDFTINLINGNKAILVYDMLSHNVNPFHAVAWKQLFKKYMVGSGEEAYKKARKVKSNG
jgi:hypothetical protein